LFKTTFFFDDNEIQTGKYIYGKPEITTV